MCNLVHFRHPKIVTILECSCVQLPLDMLIHTNAVLLSVYANET